MITMTRILRGCVLAFVFPFGFAAGAICGALAFAPVTPTRVGVRNLRSRLGAGPLSARVLLARVYFQYACYFTEIVVLWPLGLLENFGEAELGVFLRGVKERHSLPGNRGVMCLGAHFGNIEALGMALKWAYADAGLKPFYVLAKPSKSALLEGVFARMRQGRGFLVMSTGGPRFKDELRQTAASGFGLALLADQKPRKGGVFVPFFGTEAAFPEKGVTLGIEQGMAVVYVTHRRVGLGRFELVFSEGPNEHLLRNEVDGEAVSASDVERTLAAYAVWLEDTIRGTPWMWSWDYGKWSRRKDKASVEEGSVAQAS